MNDRPTFENRDQWLIARWKSGNARVDEDLVLDTEPEPALYWFKGYMYDFPVGVAHAKEELTSDICSFLRDFFDERIACGVSLEGDIVSGGGPIEPSYLGEDAWWKAPEVLIRSWRGTHDRG
ncbi:MAG TPA: hypothetical protein VEX38_05385 [Fimbriimonadaceae bacterium]|nr:hypothetical protein [Fimbriimonadaceae bacterium]